MNLPRWLFAAVLSTGLTAQSPTYMQFGNVVHSFGGNSAALLDTGAQTVTPLALLPAGINITALTWDPLSPDDLIVTASDAKVYRCTVTAAGVNRVLFTSATFAGVKQLSWDQTGNLIIAALGGGNLLWRVDRNTGAATPILSWPLSNLNCGVQDKTNGDYYLGNSSGIWRITGVPTGTPSVTLVVSTASAVTSLAFDSLQPQWLLFTRSQDLYRMNTSTFAVQAVWTGIQPIDMIRTAHDGGFRAIRSRDVFEQGNPAIIPAGGAPPTLVGSNTNVGCCSLTDACVIGETYTPFRLTIDSQVGCGATFEIANTPVGTSTTWMFFSGTTTFPVGSGPFFGLMPDGVTLVFMNAFAEAQPGNFLHSLGPPPPVTVIPPGVLCFLSGQTWDVVVASWGPTLQFNGRTNVQRLTWQ